MKGAGRTFPLELLFAASFVVRVAIVPCDDGDDEGKHGGKRDGSRRQAKRQQAAF